MPTYNITEIATGTVVFSYASDAPLSYGRADWDDPAICEHVVVADPPPPVETAAKPGPTGKKRWRFDVERNWEGYITEVTATEL